MREAGLRIKTRQAPDSTSYGPLNREILIMKTSERDKLLTTFAITEPLLQKLDSAGTLIKSFTSAALMLTVSFQSASL